MKMANHYEMEPDAFKNVLLKTVFPQDKQVTNEQLAAFCIVANQYNLNPITKEIYAFPAKGGGIIPVLSIDGWITLIQRQPSYNGHKFVYEWKDGKPGSEIISCTCVIYRKGFEFPLEFTEYFVECVRLTDVWKSKPVRMLTHKTYIQAARYAFGLSGIYDEDEAERILESEKATPVRPAVQTPQRVQTVEAKPVQQSDVPKGEIPQKTVETPKQTIEDRVAQASTIGWNQRQAEAQRVAEDGHPEEAEAILADDGIPEGAEDVADLIDSDGQVNNPLSEMVESGTLKKASEIESPKPGTIGKGLARRLHTALSMNGKKTGWTEARFRKEILEDNPALKHIVHFSDIPKKDYEMYRMYDIAVGQFDPNAE
jgi:phage recombination protein Bet